MAGKLDGSKAIQSGTITTTQLTTALSDTISAGGGPKIKSLIYPGDDTAANTIGGQTVYITGSGFDSNVAVYINGAAVPSVSYISASNVGFTTPALSAATYPVYVTNPDDGATAILIPGMLVSGEPSWVTGATLAEQDASSAWNISLSATGDAPLTYALAAGSSLPSGISLASNGTISGTITTPPETDTTYNFTVDAIDAQNQSSSRAFSVTASTGEGVLFANNVLLLHADGTNNGNNHSFLDSSNNNFTITRNGNATQGSFSPFSQTGWSAYFDGSGDYLTLSSTSLNLSTNDFTIEAWVHTSSTSQQCIAGSIANGNGAGAWMFNLNYNSNKLRFYCRYGGGTSLDYQAESGTFPTNVWTHIAVTRSGANLRMFINGTQVGTTNTTLSTNSIDNATTTYFIGRTTDGASEFTGYISNLRVIKGTAVYTSAFTPPSAPLAPIANTSLLTCQDNNFIDEGPNNFAITRNGDVSIQPYSPFAPGLLSSNSHSVYFDGTGDYLNASNATAFNLSTGDWTIECWINLSALTAEARIWSLGTYASNPEVALLIGGGGAGGSSNDLQLNYVGTSTLITASSVNSIGAWAHVAVVRSSGTTTLYVNGVSKGTTTTNPWTSSSTSLWIGGWSQNNNQMTGSISNFRVVKGTAVYTSNFTPSTSPLTAVSNTSLLACQSATLIDNSTNAFTITAYGNARPRTFNPFGQTYTSSAYSTANVGGSVYLDGTGDYLTVADNTALDMGSSDFTIQGWYYPNGSTTNYPALFSKRADGSVVGGVLVYFEQTPTLLPSLLVDIGGSWAINTQSSIPFIAYQWNHFAVVRNGSAFKLYINGVSGVSATNAGTIPDNSSAFAIGAMGANGATPINSCYISNFSIVKGTALYTNSFAPPSAPLTNIANTSLLCNFTNAGIFDQTAKNILETVGDAKVSTAQYKYGTGSMVFDGSGDRLTIPYTNSFLDLGINGEKFTIEAWIYPTNAMASTGQILSKGGGAASWSTTNGAQYQWGIQNSAAFWSWNSSGSSIQITNGNVTLNTWQHLAVTYDGTTTRTFLNGVQQETSTSGYTAPTTRNLQYIGMTQSGGYTQEYYGYIDDLRITKGYARYTANFTAPTSALKDK